jgi:hypothetical protein
LSAEGINLMSYQSLVNAAIRNGFTKYHVTAICLDLEIKNSEVTDNYNIIMNQMIRLANRTGLATEEDKVWMIAIQSKAKELSDADKSKPGVPGRTPER